MDENQNQEQPQEQKLQPETASQSTEQTTKETDNSKVMAIIAYFIFFLPLLTEYKDNDFVKYHVKQSLMLFILLVGAAVVSGIPFIGFFISTIASMALFILLIMGIINAASDKKVPVPFVGKYAEELLKF